MTTHSPQDLSIDDALARLIAERSGAEAPTITLTEAVTQVCRWMGAESPTDMVSPEFLEDTGDFMEFAMRHYLWTHLRGKSAGVVEDDIEDAQDRAIGRLLMRWSDGDRHAYDPDTVRATFSEELGRKPTTDELREMLALSDEERRVDQDTDDFLRHAADLLRERAERGVPNLTVGDVMSDALNRLERDR